MDGYEGEEDLEVEELPEEFLEDVPEESEPLTIDPEELPDVWWKDDIAAIEDPEIQQQVIDKAARHHEKWEDINKRLNAKEIDDFTHWSKALDLHSEGASLATEAGLASVGLSHRKLARVADEYDAVVKADPVWMERNELVNEFVDEDPETAQELADRMREEDEISDEAYGIISKKTGRKR